MAPPSGAAKRGQALPAVPRVVPAIPHALNKNTRDKKSSRPQSGQPSQPVEKPNETIVLAPEAVPSTEPEQLSVQAPEPVATAIQEENINQASMGEIEPITTAPNDTGLEVDQPRPVSSQSVTPSAEPLPTVEVETNGVEGSVPQTFEATPAENAAQSPSSQRPVRDLPPPFYPANQGSDAPSVASTQGRSEQQLPNQTTHQARPSANTLTFGTHRESANSSPALVANQSQAPAYSGVSGYPQVMPSFAPHTHGYHMSDQHPGPIYPPTFPPGPPPYGYPRDYANHAVPHSPRPYQQLGGRMHQPPRRHYEPHMPQRYPPPPVHHMYPPQQMSPRPTDPNSEMMKATNPDGPSTRPNPPMNRLPEQQPTGQMNSSVLRQTEQLPTTRMDSSPMAQYLRGQFGNPEFADYVVQISHSGYLFPPTMLPAHGVILARSPKLRSLITMQHGSSSNTQNNPKQLSVPISDRFLNFEIALMKALMRLYGETLPERDAVTRLAASSAYLENGNVQAVQMRFALAYAAAGHFLQMDEIISHGLQLAEGLLTWDTIGKALAFGLEGGLSSHFAQFDTPQKDKGSSSSVEDTPTKLDSPSSAPVYGYYSDRMVTSVVNFLVYNCPPQFSLVPTAPQMNDPPRLPADAEPKHLRSTSRLNQIRFGDMTLDNTGSPDPASEKISSVLLSLPFQLLAHFLESNVLGERLGWTRVATITKDVVQERELRRQRAMKNLNNSAPASAMEERLWRAVRWVESIEPHEQRPSGLKLVRHLAGDDTPPSIGSGAA